MKHLSQSQKALHGRTSRSNGDIQLSPPQGDSASISSLQDALLENRLDSWKGIASYLGREVRTVQRWEKRESLPVHRHFHHKTGSVYAFKTEIDKWRKSRSLSPSASPSTETSATPVHVAPITLAQQEVQLTVPRAARNPSGQWANGNSIPAIIYFGPEPLALPKELESLRFGKLVAVGVSTRSRRLAKLRGWPSH